MPHTMGDAMAGTMIFSTTASKWIAPVPEPTHTAPMSPPNSACEDDDGSPSSQVVRFHRMAPTRPPKMIAGVILASSTSPPEMVLATAVEMNAPTRFSTPEMATATFGRNAPVAMEVAIALAVSWKPLVKSKMRAVMMTASTRKETSTTRTVKGQHERRVNDRLHQLNENVPGNEGNLIAGH